jgi:predicted nuclease with TOPRIM domain
MRCILMLTYGATELSKMFKCSRPTVYNKFKTDELKEYVVLEDGKKRLKSEGLQLLGVLLAENKPIDKEDNVKVTDDLQGNLAHDYIESLKHQIEKLEEDKKRIQDQYKDSQDQYKELLNKYHEKDKLLLMASEKRKGFFSRLFNG